MNSFSYQSFTLAHDSLISLLTSTTLSLRRLYEPLYLKQPSAYHLPHHPVILSDLMYLNRYSLLLPFSLFQGSDCFVLVAYFPYQKVSIIKFEPACVLFANLVTMSGTVLNPIRYSQNRIVCISEKINTLQVIKNVKCRVSGKKKIGDKLVMIIIANINDTKKLSPILYSLQPREEDTGV